ncbi:MAG: flagellar protein FliS [Defluviitaleaceae bacterium]|nr:flagellar protein FliS [Defluviitaleaceae bacterium]
MDDKIKQEFTRRIKNATPMQLIVINYELLLFFMDEASAAAARMPECVAALESARAALSELHASLDMDIEFSKDLGNLYLYVNKCLIHAGMRRTNDEKNALLSDARGIVAELHKAWQTLDSDDGLYERLLGENSQKIFAGLTYGKDGRLEEFQDFNPDGGYKA